MYKYIECKSCTQHGGVDYIMLPVGIINIISDVPHTAPVLGRVVMNQTHFSELA